MMLAARDQPSRGRIHHERCAFDLRCQRRDASGARGTLGPCKRGTCRLRVEAPDRYPGDRQLMGNPAPRRKRGGVEPVKPSLGFVEAADQQKAADLEISRMRGVQPVASLFERLGPESRERRYCGAKWGANYSRIITTVMPKANFMRSSIRTATATMNN